MSCLSVMKSPSTPLAIINYLPSEYAVLMSLSSLEACGSLLARRLASRATNVPWSSLLGVAPVIAASSQTLLESVDDTVICVLQRFVHAVNQVVPVLFCLEVADLTACCEFFTPVVVGCSEQGRRYYHHQQGRLNISRHQNGAASHIFLLSLQPGSGQV